MTRVRSSDNVPSCLGCSVALFYFASFSLLSFSLWILVCNFYSAVFQLANAVLESTQSFVEKERNNRSSVLCIVIIVYTPPWIHNGPCGLPSFTFFSPMNGGFLHGSHGGRDC